MKIFVNLSDVTVYIKKRRLFLYLVRMTKESTNCVTILVIYENIAQYGKNETSFSFKPRDGDFLFKRLFNVETLVGEPSK